MAAIKADDAEQGGNASLARVVRKRRGGEGDAEVRAALADGYESFCQRVTCRLLADPVVLQLINRCPNCDRVVRSPLARQCLWCGHAWRGTDASDQASNVKPPE